MVEPTRPRPSFPKATIFSVLHLDPGLELVRLAEAVGVAQPLELPAAEVGRRRLVVVADPELEGDLGHALDRLRGDPRDGGD